MKKDLIYIENQDLQSAINSAIERLKEKIKRNDFNSLEIDDFYKNKYLAGKIRSIEKEIIKYGYHIYVAILLGSYKEIRLKDFVLIDHGGGTGFLGLLAKEVGIGTVIYNDIDPKFLDVAKSVGEQLELTSEHYVLGDIDDLIEFLRNKQIECNSIASYDVIEHIYDMEIFLNKMHLLSNNCIGLIMSSGANIFNPRYLSKVIPIQKKADKKWSAIRETIIRENFPSFDEKTIKILTKATKGLTRDLIIKRVEQYRLNGVYHKISHKTNTFDPFGTNTCDPTTGWWAEHLLNPFALMKILNETGFESDIWPGTYHGKRFRIFKGILNRGIKYLGNTLSLPIAPYYSLVARKNS